jgi:uncharacterized membrane protein YgdD (TMEM256/DUF423 family)
LVPADADRFVSIMSQNRLFMISGLFGAAGVILGALGAHGFHEQLIQHQTTGIWQIAVLYHLVHTAALLALASQIDATTGRLFAVRAAAAGCWMGGILLFSGSLYGLALGAPRMLGPITPIGGVLLLAGWVFVAISGWCQRPGPTPS